MDEQQILDQVNSLVGEEHQLRQRRQAGELDSGEEQARLQQLEQALDQCWDLLRQRWARQEFGQDVTEAKVRPVSEVESYWQ